MFQYQLLSDIEQILKSILQIFLDLLVHLQYRESCENIPLELTWFSINTM